MPKFKDYVMIGDSVEYTPEDNNPRGFSIRATIAHDSDSTPYDVECYDEGRLRSWLDGEWFFCGVILSVWKSEVCLSDHAASLWGIECNLGGDNSYLTEVLKELEGDALQEAENVLQKLTKESK